jgi:hypothetical protein
MKKLYGVLAACLMIAWCSVGVGAVGGVYDMKTKSGEKQVQVNDCVVVQIADKGPTTGTIVDICEVREGGSGSGSEIIYTIEILKDNGASCELIDISAEDTSEKILS